MMISNLYLKYCLLSFSVSFVNRCFVQGNMEISTLREVDVKSGLPATTSTERLELLDDDEHILSDKIIGGEGTLAVKLLFSQVSFEGIYRAC
ncbi:abscisic acid receptor pyl8 [Phtheirospermum japonicum]|uniref:Abscisic acid receptor pyl8 n=1 Tax=Phtheirospermum japonicum TaxID=374723 RepID=A0A830CUR3_9LAMI|nr:abscisic acid receptor pyl8 [Phtheirospermum japonicum]